MNHFTFATLEDIEFSSNEKKKTVKCKITGTPKPMERTRFTMKGSKGGKPRPYPANKVVTDSFASAVKDAIDKAATSFSFDLTDNDKPVEIFAKFFFPRPIGHHTMDGKVIPNAEHFVTKKPDIDNLVKLVLDGLQQLFYKDDCCVAHIDAQKLWMGKPGEKMVRHPGCVIFKLVQHEQNVQPS